MKNSFKNIIFDLGGVIINLNQELTIKAFKDLYGNDFERMHANLEKENWLKRFEVGEFTENKFYEFFKKYQPSISDFEIKNAWNAMLLDIPIERIKLIQSLSEKYTIFLLSNTNSIHYTYIENYLQQNFKKIDFKVLFKKLYLSYQINLRKPNKLIFEYLLNDANIKPEETLFIDDTLEHIESAKSLGIKTKYLNVTNKETLTELNFFE